jgi:hypothetical protein
MSKGKVCYPAKARDSDGTRKFLQLRWCPTMDAPDEDIDEFAVWMSDSFDLTNDAEVWNITEEGDKIKKINVYVLIRKANCMPEGQTYYFDVQKKEEGAEPSCTTDGSSGNKKKKKRRGS